MPVLEYLRCSETLKWQMDDFGKEIEYKQFDMSDGTAGMSILLIVLLWASTVSKQ